ncbi:MAG: hypothetical protein K0Q43_5720 [Ramlibacter sp.]|nr:hypothetical protein [Ramlibacter sp.]
MASDSIFQLTRRSFVAAFAAWAATARGQDEGKGCAMILLHAKASGSRPARAARWRCPGRPGGRRTNRVTRPCRRSPRKPRPCASKATSVSWCWARDALPALSPKIAQHVPVLWLVGGNDPLRERGEDFAFAKAPPHPASKFRLLKSDIGNAPDAAAGPILEWIKTLD